MDPERFALGLVVILGGFAIKSGVGLYVGLFVKNAFPKRGRLLLFYPSVYLSLFLGLGLLWASAQDLKSTVQWVLSYGAEIHILVSLFFIYLGIRFLLAPKDMAGSKRWLVLMIPCPVCAITVFMSIGILISFYPEHQLSVIFISYGIFMCLGILTLATMYLAVKYKLAHDLNLFVGLILVFASLYTILILFVSEGYLQSGKILNIAAEKVYSNPAYPKDIVLASYFVCILAFLGGLIKRRSY